MATLRGLRRLGNGATVEPSPSLAGPRAAESPIHDSIRSAIRRRPGPETLAWDQGFQDDRAFCNIVHRANSLLSTGPRTQAGKEQSRANALKHGLCAAVVVAEDAELVQRRSVDFFKTLRPQNHFHCWLVTEVALLSIRIDRSERIERRVRDKVAIGAELSWDDDRRIEAALLGGSLGHRPEVVVEQLRKNPQGCEWLMGRWAMLAHSADVHGTWTPEQDQLAFDLLGTPAEFRRGHKPGASLDFDGRVVESANDPAAVARREITALRDRRELVEGLDEAARSLAMSDLGDDSDPELRRLRRYEATLHGRLRWCLAQLRHQSPHQEPFRGLMTTWLGQQEPLSPEAEAPPAPPIPEPKAEAPPESAGWLRPIHPPFDLEADEVPPSGQELDIPAILASRREKRLEKAQARRESRRRQLERLRA